MDDLAGTLSAFLNSPEGKARLQNLAGMLAQNQEEAPAPSGDSGGLSSLLGALGGSSETSVIPDASALQLVTRLGPMLSAARQEDDRIRLLKALRPLLGEERQKKLDESIRILQLMRMLPMLRETGLLSGLL